MILNRFVERYTNLPDWTLELHGIRLPFNRGDVDIEFFNGVRSQYRATGLWMKYYLCNDSKALPELRFTNKADFKPYADVSLAWYRLAQETLLLSPELAKFFQTPAHLWLLTEMEKCDVMLEKIGVTGSGSRPLSKRKQYEETTWFANLDISKLPVRPGKTLHSPTHILINEAMLLAATPQNEKFRARYRDFTRILKRCDREILNSDLQPHYLNDGVIRSLRSK